MKPDVYTALLIVVMSLVTILLRTLPFLIFSGKKKVPRAIVYLGQVLPSAIMGMLVIYCLREVQFTVSPFGARELAASAVVVAMQLWRKNSILSILAGTGVYVLLVNFL